ncbi:MAG: hypothetical protein R3D89_12165 [Sphingomonadaceae bacterium]
MNDPRAGSDAFPDYLVNLNPLTAAPDLRLFTTDGGVPNFDTVASPVVSIIDGDPSDNVAGRDHLGRSDLAGADCHSDYSARRASHG